MYNRKRRVTCNLFVTVVANNPLNGKCRTEYIIYKYSSLNESNLKKVYLGLMEEEFKTNRYHNHQQSFRKQKCSKSTYQPTYRTSKEHQLNILI